MTSKYFLVKVTMPPGIAIADLSRQFPEIPFHVVSGQWMAVDERIVFLMAEAWTDEQVAFLKKHPAVKELDTLANIVRIHIKTSFLRDIEQSRITVLYPTHLQNGEHSIGFMLEPEQFALLQQRLPKLQVLTIQDRIPQRPILTKRQLEVLYQADALGYYRYPRNITLTDLAKLLRISKVTLSQTLRTIEKKAIDHLLEDQIRYKSNIAPQPRP